MKTDDLLSRLRHRARTSTRDLAAELNTSEEDVASAMAKLEQDGVILGYQTVLDPQKVNASGVIAVIEVRITPERGGGFDRLAARIAKFDEVQSCYLMSGAYDLLVVVEGRTLHDVSSFIAEKLSTIKGVISTATHFRLKAYKENGSPSSVKSASSASQSLPNLPSPWSSNDRLPITSAISQSPASGSFSTSSPSRRKSSRSASASPISIRPGTSAKPPSTRSSRAVRITLPISACPSCAPRSAATCNRHFGVAYDPRTEVIITVGVSEAIDLALRVLLNPGDEVLYHEPCYVSYSPSVIMAFGKPVAVPTSAIE